MYFQLLENEYLGSREDFEAKETYETYFDMRGRSEIVGVGSFSQG